MSNTIYEVLDATGRVVTTGCPSLAAAVDDARRRVRASSQKETFKVVSTDKFGYRFTEYRARPYVGVGEEELIDGVLNLPREV